jgi:hypothetical protein
MTPNQEITVTQVVPEVPCSEERALLHQRADERPGRTVHAELWNARFDVRRLLPSYPYLHSVVTGGGPVGMGGIIELSLDQSPHAMGSCGQISGRGIDNSGPRP